MWRQQFARKAIAYGAATTVAGYAGYSYYKQQAGPYARTVYADPLETPTPPGMRPHAFWTPPKRVEMLNDLK
ncbi:hypothetical protein LPJ62_006103, partial [Coemansia sp. RSA 2167]